MLPAIAASDNGRPAVLASRASDRARQMAEPYPGLRVVPSYDAVLDDPEVDAVYIPLVNSLHLEWTLRSLQAGKHVLCEKPLAMDAGEAETIARAARASGLCVMEAFMYRFHPAMRAFVDAVREPLHVQASFGFTLAGDGNYRLQAELGGGALLDVGCYTVSVARWILGEPVDVLARARVRDGVDMTVVAMLEFEGQRTASLWASFESPEEQQLTVVTRERVFRRERPFTSGRDPHDPYQLMVESFAGSVINERPVAIPLEESIANMRALDRVAEAMATPSAAPGSGDRP